MSQASVSSGVKRGRTRAQRPFPAWTFSALHAELSKLHSQPVVVTVTSEELFGPALGHLCFSLSAPLHVAAFPLPHSPSLSLRAEDVSFEAQVDHVSLESGAPGFTPFSAATSQLCGLGQIAWFLCVQISSSMLGFCKNYTQYLIHKGSVNISRSTIMI